MYYMIRLWSYGVGGSREVWSMALYAVSILQWSSIHWSSHWCIECCTSETFLLGKPGWFSGYALSLCYRRRAVGSLVGASFNVHVYNIIIRQQHYTHFSTSHNFIQPFSLGNKLILPLFDLKYNLLSVYNLVGTLSMSYLTHLDPSLCPGWLYMNQCHLG